VTAPLRLGTERLILRPWREADRAPYAAMMADEAVAFWVGGTLDAERAGAQIDYMTAHLQTHGFSFLAIERRADGAFLGAAGLLSTPPNHPMAPAVEVGWRLAREAWGSGYATEAAAAVIADGFARVGLEEILAFTAVLNARSRAVMARLDLERRRELDFEHPFVAEGHPLRPHLVFSRRAP
jgi:RimJ/RimL family protein N-acetyltransferase